MMEAQRLITASEDIVIAEISAACGYMSTSCFAAAFKRHFACRQRNTGLSRLRKGLVGIQNKVNG
jgi:AraC-like DNA-binding protein